MVVYKAMFELFGIGSYVPYRLAAIVLALLCAALFYSIARRRIGNLLALAPTILLLFLGSGWEVLITGMRLPSLFAIASGLAAILLLERDDGRGDAWAAGLLCVSVTSHPTGLGFLAAAATLVAFRPPPRRWKSSWVILIPAALFGAFLVLYQRTAGNAPDVLDLLAFARDSWTTLTAAVSGLSGVLDAPVYDRPAAEIASMALLAVIVVGAALRWRRLRPTFWAAVAGLVTLLVATRLSPGGFIREPDAPRYLYPETVLFLWILVELAAAWWDAGTARIRTVVAGLVTGVLLLGVWSNVAKLDDASSRVRTSSMIARGQYSAYELARGRLSPSYAPNPFLPSAGSYLSAAAAYGSIGLICERARPSVPARARGRRQSTGWGARPQPDARAPSARRMSGATASRTDPARGRRLDRRPRSWGRHFHAGSFRGPSGRPPDPSARGPHPGCPANTPRWRRCAVEASDGFTQPRHGLRLGRRDMNGLRTSAMVAAIAAVGAALRLVVLQDSLFADELSTYWVVSEHDLDGVISTVHSDAEITPPLYFVLAWLTTRVDLTAEMLRAPSFLAGVAAIPLVYLVGARTVGRTAALVAAAITALSPFMVYYSTEARGYELMVALALLSTLAMLVAIDDRRARWWTLYAASSCAAVYTHYTAVFVLAAQLIWLLWARPEARRPALLANLGAALAFLPWITGLIADLNSPTTKILGALEPFDLESVTIVLEHWSIGYPQRFVGLGSVPGTIAVILICAGVAVAIVSVAVRRSPPASWFARGDPWLALIVALALAAPVSEAAVSLVGTNILSIRNLAVSWPAFALLLATLVSAGRGPLRIASVSLLVAGFGIGAATMLDPATSASRLRGRRAIRRTRLVRARRRHRRLRAEPWALRRLRRSARRAPTSAPGRGPSGERASVWLPRSGPTARQGRSQRRCRSRRWTHLRGLAARRRAGSRATGYLHSARAPGGGEASRSYRRIATQVYPGILPAEVRVYEKPG